MASSSASKSKDNSLNHMIIWLDQHMGKEKDCIFLKSSFFMAMDPTSRLFEREMNKSDIDRSICLEAPFLERLNEVEFIFQAFDDIVKCYQTIEKKSGETNLLDYFWFIG